MDKGGGLVRDRGHTVTINTQRRMPHAMTKVPPLKRIRSSSFSRQGRRALKRICVKKNKLVLAVYIYLSRVGEGHTGVGMEIKYTSVATFNTTVT